MVTIRGGRLTLGVSINPAPILMIAGLKELSPQIRSFREPLQRSIQRVLGPSFQKNFDVGGRPPWESLAAGTVAIRGSSQPILVQSGTLREVAGQLNIWTIEGGYLRDIGEAYVTQLPERAFYGAFHQRGTFVMPQREFLTIQPEDMDRVAEIFAEWFEERGVDIGFNVSSGF